MPWEVVHIHGLVSAEGSPRRYMSHVILHMWNGAREFSTARSSHIGQVAEPGLKPKPCRALIPEAQLCSCLQGPVRAGLTLSSPGLSIRTTWRAWEPTPALHGGSQVERYLTPSTGEDNRTAARRAGHRAARPQALSSTFLDPGVTCRPAVTRWGVLMVTRGACLPPGTA